MNVREVLLVVATAKLFGDAGYVADLGTPRAARVDEEGASYRALRARLRRRERVDAAVARGWAGGAGVREALSGRGGGTAMNVRKVPLVVATAELFGDAGHVAVNASTRPLRAGGRVVPACAKRCPVVVVERR